MKTNLISDFYPWLVLIILFFLLLYLVKKRFGRNDCLYIYICTTNGYTIQNSEKMKKIPLTSDFWHSILPGISQQTEIYGLPVRASKNGIEVKIGDQMIAREIDMIQDPSDMIQVPDPLYKDDIEKGWHEMMAGDAIVVYKNNNMINLYLYKSED